MANIKVASININGIRNRMKRKAFFRNLKNDGYNIICVQESHITDNEKEEWEREWAGKMFHTSVSKHSMGQLILIKHNFSYDVKCIFKSDRVLTVCVYLPEKNVYVTNVYAPNNPAEKKDFFTFLTNHIQSLDSENQIVTGDFNCVLSNKQDIVTGEGHNRHDVDMFSNFVVQSDLNDIWRLMNPEEKEFTWSKKNPFIARRLDYILINDNILNNTNECAIRSLALSDHRLVVMCYNVSQIQRGPSYWKFNDSLLKDTKFVSEMNLMLDTFLIQNQVLDDIIKWELCKIKIKEFCINYSKSKYKTQRNRRIELQIELEKLDRDLGINEANEESLKQREKIKKELGIYELQEAKGAQTRSKIKFIEEGEKNTKYFLNLEKARSNTKILDKITKEDGECVVNHQDIMKEQVRFFKQRYKNNYDFQEETANDFTRNINVPKISEEQKESLEGQINDSEISIALKKMKNGSSPGSDGISTGFLKFFWIKIKIIVLKAINSAYSNGELSLTQRKAIITLIHKRKNLPRDNLNNWRPISLTNTDYKILAKCLAIRLDSVISHIIHEDQVGFIKGRSVSTTIRTIDDIIQYLNTKKRAGILLAVDFKAAFDSISKDYILWAFKQFGFGPSFIKWIDVLTKQTKSAINYMGWISESFDMESGIRQGCPFSPMAFVVALEILAIKIRNDHNIKGLNIPKGKEHYEQSLKTLLYADDVTLFLQDREDLKNALSLVTFFSKFSGLAMNRNKTEAMWLGSSKYCKEELEGLKWKLQIKILGIYFNTAIPASEIEDNWLPRLEQIQRLISQWSKRNLSIMGKICIFKSLLLSQLIYPLQALAAPTDIVKKVNTLMFRFIWKKKYSNTRAFEKVKRLIMIQPSENGGLNMIKIDDMQNSFLLSWATKLTQDNDNKWKWIPSELFDQVGGIQCCLQSDQKPSRFKGTAQITNTFWKKVLTVWLETKHKLKDNYFNHVEFNKQCIWNHSYISYRKQTLFFKDWIKAGIASIDDVTENDNFIGYERICEITGYKPSRLFECNALQTAINAYRKRYNRNIVNTPAITTLQTRPQKIRQELIKETHIEPLAIRFWQTKLGVEITKEHWLLANKCTGEVRLRLLHWKILHNIYPTNILLYKIGVKNTEYCDYCQQKDYIEHFFWDCSKIKTIWGLVKHDIYIRTGKQIKLSVTDVLLGYRSTDFNSHDIQFINKTILIAKMCISKFRYGTAHNIACIYEAEMNLRST